MRLYAGVDVGIKNLAFCVIDAGMWRAYQSKMSNNPGIKLWLNINLVGAAETCAGLIKSGTRKGQECGKKASWTLEKDYYCGVHKPQLCKKYREPKVKNLDIRALKKRAFMEMDKIEIFNQVEHIAIETQRRINQQMKMFGASIEAYFIIRQQIDKQNLKVIRSSPAKNKLKMYDGPYISTDHIKDPYDKRKYLAEKQTEYFLSRAEDVLETHFHPYKKKDDLADAFLHCIMAIK